MVYRTFSQISRDNFPRVVFNQIRPRMEQDGLMDYIINFYIYINYLYQLLTDLWMKTKNNSLVYNVQTLIMDVPRTATQSSGYLAFEHCPAMSGDQLAISKHFFNNVSYIVHRFTGHESLIFRALMNNAWDIGEWFPGIGWRCARRCSPMSVMFSPVNFGEVRIEVSRFFINSKLMNLIYFVTFISWQYSVEIYRL